LLGAVCWLLVRSQLLMEVMALPALVLEVLLSLDQSCPRSHGWRSVIAAVKSRLSSQCDLSALL
jgi:hypothetical protein